jgi:ketosteroid isomerase-like protein
MRSALEVVKAFYAAASKGNVEEMARQMAPEVRWTEMAGTPYGGTYVGPDAVLTGVFVPLGEEWVNYTFTPDRFHDAGNSVAVSGWYTAVFVKTGKPMRCRSLHVWDVCDGKVTAFEQFCDSLVMHRSMV